MAAPIDITRSIQTKAEDTAVVRPPVRQLRRRRLGQTVTARPAGPRLRRSGTTTQSVRRPGSPLAATAAYGITATRTRRLSRPSRTPGSRAVLVVCDGVSTSLDSDVASLAAARAARDALVAHRPAGLGTAASRAAAISNAVVKAAATANAAVIESTAPGSDNAASCTFAAAVVEDGVVVFGNVGDSRVYWIPDHGSGE